MPNLTVVRAHSTPVVTKETKLKNPLTKVSVESVRRVSEDMKKVLLTLETYLTAKPSKRFDLANSLCEALLDLGSSGVEGSAEIAAILRGEL